MNILEQVFLFLVAVVAFVAFIGMATAILAIAKAIWIATGESDARSDAERDAGLLDHDLDEARSKNRSELAAAMRGHDTKPQPTPAP